MKLGLGTVQFGRAYGITNAAGRPPLPEVRAILDVARKTGVAVLDTAPEYGECENILGRSLSDDDQFAIITKTPNWQGSPGAGVGDEVVRSLEQSLRDLAQDRVAALLVHDAEDLLSPRGPAIWSALEALRQNGRTERIGVSVYTGDQIDHVLGQYRPDVIQLPVSALDQRLVQSGHVERLHKLGIELHARSVLLQGVMLADPDHLPPQVSELRQQLTRFRKLARRAMMTPLQAALSFVRSLPVDAAIVGATKPAELTAIVAAFEAPTATDIAWISVAGGSAPALDPRNWAA
jgi:aryl-alcohol dehydrogenase-like predicted oxidoreductase